MIVGTPSSGKSILMKILKNSNYGATLSHDVTFSSMKIPSLEDHKPIALIAMEIGLHALPEMAVGGEYDFLMGDYYLFSRLKIWVTGVVESNAGDFRVIRANGTYDPDAHTLTSNDGSTHFICISDDKSGEKLVLLPSSSVVSISEEGIKTEKLSWLPEGDNAHGDAQLVEICGISNAVLHTEGMEYDSLDPVVLTPTTFMPGRTNWDHETTGPMFEWMVRCWGLTVSKDPTMIDRVPLHVLGIINPSFYDAEDSGVLD